MSTLWLLCLLMNPEVDAAREFQSAFGAAMIGMLGGQFQVHATREIPAEIVDEELAGAEPLGYLASHGVKMVLVRFHVPAQEAMGQLEEALVRCAWSRSGSSAGALNQPGGWHVPFCRPGQFLDVAMVNSGGYETLGVLCFRDDAGECEPQASDEALTPPAFDRAFPEYDGVDHWRRYRTHQSLEVSGEIALNESLAFVSARCSQSLRDNGWACLADQQMGTVCVSYWCLEVEEKSWSGSLIVTRHPSTDARAEVLFRASIED